MRGAVATADEQKGAADKIAAVRARASAAPSRHTAADGAMSQLQRALDVLRDELPASQAQEREQLATKLDQVRAGRRAGERAMWWQCVCAHT